MIFKSVGFLFVVCLFFLTLYSNQEKFYIHLWNYSTTLAGTSLLRSQGLLLAQRKANLQNTAASYRLRTTILITPSEVPNRMDPETQQEWLHQWKCSKFLSSFILHFLCKYCWGATMWFVTSACISYSFIILKQHGRRYRRFLTSIRTPFWVAGWEYLLYCDKAPCTTQP